MEKVTRTPGSAVSLPGSVRLDISMRECRDRGIPLMLEFPTSDTADIFTTIAHRLVAAWTPTLSTYHGMALPETLRYRQAVLF